LPSSPLIAEVRVFWASLRVRVLIRPLPYAEPDRLVTLWEDASYISFPRNAPTVANFMDWQKQSQVFSALAASRDRAGSLTGDGPPEMVLGGAVTSNLFEVLGVQPLLGRAFTEEEDRSGENVIILSYGLWQLCRRPWRDRPQHPDERCKDHDHWSHAARIHLA